MRLFGYHISINKPKKYTALHKALTGFTQYAFTIDGNDFYQFKNYLDMPALRYQMMNAFISEAEMRMTRDEAKEYIRLIRESIDNNSITKVVAWLNQIDYRLDQFMETDTFYRLFSCAFFTKDEDLTIYDYDFNDWKIELFKKQPATSFFFMSQMKELLPQVDISESDLNHYLAQTKAIKEALYKLKYDGTEKQ